MKATVYQKPTCNTCRELARQLGELNIDHEKIDYYIDGLDEDRLRELIKKMGVSAREILRVKADEYKTLGLDDESISEDVLIQSMVKYPDLMQRPIVEMGDKAILARPAERIKELVIG